MYGTMTGTNMQYVILALFSLVCIPSFSTSNSQAILLWGNFDFRKYRPWVDQVIWLLLVKPANALQSNYDKWSAGRLETTHSSAALQQGIRFGNARREMIINNITGGI
ncbi:hypothetical protein F5X96DRAFT_566963 [Biscogniauxia mediterranea]|nr:hypothetical protein F5X96DRAFT_566963 [Biscogniauxia mediterranea]